MIGDFTLGNPQQGTYEIRKGKDTVGSIWVESAGGQWFILGQLHPRKWGQELPDITFGLVDHLSGSRNEIALKTLQALHKKYLAKVTVRRSPVSSKTPEIRF